MHGETNSIALFVVGAQRSGTNMLMDVLEQSLDAWTYNEGEPEAFRKYRLRPAHKIERLVQNSPTPVVAFKPISDSQHTDQLLERHAGSKAIWIFRRYQDVANSALRRWGHLELARIRRLATKEPWTPLPEESLTDEQEIFLTRSSWLGERLPAELWRLVNEIYDEGMTDASAASLKWYLRNSLFFSLNLDRNPESVKLVRYEDLVSNPTAHFGDIFQFLQITFDPSFVSSVVKTSIAKHPFPEIDSRVAALCEDLTRQLESALSGHTNEPGNR